jgi:hypothetical protein
MKISLQAIETDIGTLLHTAAARVPEALAAAGHVAAEIEQDVAKVEPFARALLTRLSPQNVAAEQAVVGIINAVASAVEQAGENASKGLSVSLVPELVAIFKDAMAKVLAYENSL